MRKFPEGIRELTRQRQPIGTSTARGSKKASYRRDGPKVNSDDGITPQDLVDANREDLKSDGGGLGRARKPL